MAVRHLIREGLRALIGAALTYALVAQLLIGATASARHAAEIAAGGSGLAAICITHAASDTPFDGPARHDHGGACCDWGCCPGGAPLPGQIAILAAMSGHGRPAEVSARSEIIAGRNTSGRPQQPRAPPAG